MLTGLWFAICTLLVTIAALLVVGTLIAGSWVQSMTETSAAMPASLVAVTVALTVDLVVLVNLFMPLPIIHGIPGSDNVPLFSEWQVISGVLIVLALCLSLFEGKEVNKATCRASLILLMIHGAGTLLFFSDSVISWLKTI